MKNKRNLIVIGIALILVIIITIVIIVVKDAKREELIKQTNEELSYLFTNEPLKAEDDVYSLQAKTDNLINEAMNDSKYTLDDPYILENPYYISPLTAIIVFQTDKEVEATLTVDGKEYSFEKTKKHAIPVYGLVAGVVNTITIDCDGKTKSIDLDMTDVVDDLNLDVQTGLSADLGDDIYIITTPGDEGMFGFNTDGKLVWRLTETFSLAITKLDNGHLLLGDSNYISISFSRKGLVEIDYLGKIYNVYDIDGGYHHDAITLANGNILLGSSKINSGTYNDYIIEIDPNTGKVVKDWDLSQIVDNISEDFVESLNNPSWAFNNSIYYDEDTNSLILSLRGRNSIISIGYEDSELNWIFGDPKYWNNDFSKYFVTLDSGDYPLGSHTAAINSDGNLVLFNNNMDSSSEEDSACAPYINSKSSGEIYKIDGSKATLVSEFNDNNSFFSYAVSNYNELNNGNYLLFSAWQFAPGSMTTSSDCTLNQISENLSSTIYELDKNNNILFKATMNFGSYRATKLSLYEETNPNFNPVTVNYYNTLDETMYDTIQTSDIVDKLKNAPSENFSLEITENLLTINAAFQNYEQVYVLFVSESGNNTYRYLVKTSGYYLQPVVNTRGLEGVYAIFLVINDEYYNLDVTYEF